MPSPLPTRTLKRPPIAQTGSSSYSLRGMGQTIPTFQNFVKRTPTPDPLKPLPPTPLFPRRRSSWADSSSGQSSASSRRSSSVYSRTVSQWDSDEASDVPAIPSWRTVDFSDHTNVLLKPIAFSASTPQLLDKQPTLLLLEPRTYDPLIMSPSPSVSRATSASASPEPRPSLLLPPPPTVAHLPKDQLRTVTLEKAREALNAPGAIHLLPEELRAQRSTLGRSRSHEPVRITSLAIIAGRISATVPKPTTLADSQGRDRLLHSPDGMASSLPGGAFDHPPTSPLVRIESDGLVRVGIGPVRPMAPLAAQMRPESRTKAAKALGVEDAGEHRGRTMHRGPRDISYDHYLPKPTKRLSRDTSSSLEGEMDAHAIAKEYHSLLTEQYRQPSGSPTYDSTNSDEGVRAHMKMVPKPLFHGKSPTTPSNAGRDTRGAGSPSHLRVDSGVATSQKSRSRSERDPYSKSPSSGHRRLSTSGSIPISPPSGSYYQSPASFQSAARSSHESNQPPPKAKQGSTDERAVSAYYPHIVSRKSSKGRDKSRTDLVASSESTEAPPLPLLAADIIAQRLQTPERTPESLPLHTSAGIDVARESDTGSIYSDRSTSTPLHQRKFKGVAKVAEQLTRPADSPERPAKRIFASPSKSERPESPHLLPSPSSVKEWPTVHFDLSKLAQSPLDKARLSIRTQTHPSQPVLQHILTPARPLDERKSGLQEPDSSSRTGSIFGGGMDTWRESKQSRRREELKKIIKVVTPASVEEADPPISRPSIM